MLFWKRKAFTQLGTLQSQGFPFTVINQTKMLIGKLRLLENRIIKQMILAMDFYIWDMLILAENDLEYI